MLEKKIMAVSKLWDKQENAGLLQESSRVATTWKKLTRGSIFSFSLMNEAVTNPTIPALASSSSCAIFFPDQAESLKLAIQLLPKPSDDDLRISPELWLGFLSI